MPRVGTFKARWFKLWEPEELAAFVKVMDHVVNGEFSIKTRLDVPLPDYPSDEPGGSLKVWLEWVQVSVVPPRQAGFGGVSVLPPPAFTANIPLGGQGDDDG